VSMMTKAQDVLKGKKDHFCMSLNGTIRLNHWSIARINTNILDFKRA